MKKRLVASVLLVVMLVSLLAACGEKTPADTTGTPNNGEQQVSTNFTVPEGGYDGSAVTITFYNTMGTNLAPVLADYIEVFNEKYPNITVNSVNVGSYDDCRDQISTELTVGNQPNIAYC